MITAATITDEQIRELRHIILSGRRTDDDRALAGVCSDALPGSERWMPIADWGETRPVGHADRMDARARCAEILNARAKKVQ